MPRSIIPHTGETVPMSSSGTLSVSGTGVTSTKIAPHTAAGAGGGYVTTTAGSSSVIPGGAFAGGSWTVPPEVADMDDSEKLRAIADWFEATQDPEDGEIETDLRRIADRLNDYVGPTDRLEMALRLLYEEVLSQPLVFDDRGDQAVSEAIETLSAWLSDR